MDEYLYNLWMETSRHGTKAINYKKKIGTCDNIKIKNFCMTNTINKVKNKTQIGKIFRTHVRGLIFLIKKTSS